MLRAPPPKSSGQPPSMSPELCQGYHLRLRISSTAGGAIDDVYNGACGSAAPSQ